MKQTFLLDENVFIAAETLQNEQQVFDRSSADLVVAIAANCHSLVLNLEVHRRYARKSDAMRRDRLPSGGVRMMALLNSLMVNSEKCRFLPPEASAPIPGEAALPDDDVFLLRLAAATSAIFVTTDDRLIRRVAEQGVDIPTMRPEQALPLAQHAN